MCGVRFVLSWCHVGGKIAAVFGAWVFGMRSVRRTRAAGVLPDAAPLIPMEAQTVKGIGRRPVAGLGKLQPNPSADNFGQLVLVRQFFLEQIQNFLRGQFAVVIVFRHPRGAG